MHRACTNTDSRRHQPSAFRRSCSCKTCLHTSDGTQLQCSSFRCVIITHKDQRCRPGSTAFVRFATHRGVSPAYLVPKSPEFPPQRTYRFENARFAHEHLAVLLLASQLRADHRKVLGLAVQLLSK